MQELIQEIVAYTEPTLPHKKDWRIGIVGSGFIVDECQLVAYRSMGITPMAIASKEPEIAEKVAKKHGIANVYTSWQEMLETEQLDILDIAIPPHIQLQVVEEAVKHFGIRGILCQKPISMSLEDTRKIVRLGKDAGVKIAVNSNMRYDQSMRALKYVLDQGLLGDPVLATIEMRAIPHWQEFLKAYDKLELFGMGIHHIDIFRYLFGDPKEISATCRTDPRSKFPHVDGITQYTYLYENGLMATSLDDVWAWPGPACEKDTYIKWRVEGTEGMATGTIGWPGYPQRQPSTMRLTCNRFPHQWIEPKWETVWFPDAFKGTMASLLCAIEQGTEPEISAEDNISTIACVEACYESIRLKRTVRFNEIAGTTEYSKR